MSLIREYETTFILRPDIQQADKARITERVKSIIEEQFSGEVRRIEEWGKRQLAYLMQKQSFGIYVYVRYAARPDAIAEIERILRLNDLVLKFLTVVLEDGQDSGKRPDQSDVSYDDVDDMDEEE
ncbi:MAG: 30S ribosomal protein S6 [Myxococcales bacterium]|jgi:small subunit ribosomal protein S6|nr:30S ribosomal protein S6 [Myxococcales bacterium]